MPRPRKWRKVCCMPESTQFGPITPFSDPDYFVLMTVEEYESIRLIDLAGLTQEECADQMNIARTTVQRIYADARRKIAESLVLGKVLRIGGGDYQLCDGFGDGCGKFGGCGRHCCARKPTENETEKKQDDNCENV